MNDLSIYQLCGLVGFAGYMISFTLLQTGRLRGDSISYAMWNVFAPAFVLISLVEHFNIASAMIQIAWICIACYGISRHFNWSFSTRWLGGMRKPFSVLATTLLFLTASGLVLNNNIEPANAAHSNGFISSKISH